jgi:lipopolysaccharide transport system ATP-binding protein
LGKHFNSYHAEKPVTIMEAAISGLRRIRPVEHFWALRHVDFTVAPSKMLGIIGHNGAGKSTLLQLLGGLTRPNEGKIHVNGRVGALLDLGAGFHGDLTGRENVFVNATVAGLTHKEITRRFDLIVQFAELEAFVDNPVRTYSTGMMMRLAFSIAVHTNPQVLLVDEFLSVGDLAFQAKCLNRIAELKEQGCAIVLVSHDVEQVKKLCDQALWLKQGQIVAYGEPEVVAGQYTSEMRSQTQQRTPQRPSELTQSGAELKVNENRFGSLEVEITNVKLLPSEAILQGDSLLIELEYLASKQIEAPIFSVAISNEAGQICLDTNTLVMKFATGFIQDRGCIQLRIERLDLAGGQYFVDVGIYEQNWEYAYDYHWHVYSLVIHNDSMSKGLIQPPMSWQVNNVLSKQDNRQLTNSHLES